MSKKSVKAVGKLSSSLRQLILDQGDASAAPHVDSLSDLLMALLR